VWVRVRRATLDVRSSPLELSTATPVLRGATNDRSCDQGAPTSSGRSGPSTGSGSGSGGRTGTGTRVKAHCNRSAGSFQRNAFADAESAVLVTVARLARSDPRS
jgi:hypothetical protein